MFVQQMHFYNTIIEDIPTEANILYPSNEGKNTTLSDENVNTKHYQESLDRLRTYECRALNLFR